LKIPVVSRRGRLQLPIIVVKNIHVFRYLLYWWMFILCCDFSLVCLRSVSSAKYCMCLLLKATSFFSYPYCIRRTWRCERYNQKTMQWKLISKYNLTIFINTFHVTNYIQETKSERVLLIEVIPHLRRMCNYICFFWPLHCLLIIPFTSSSSPYTIRIREKRCSFFFLINKL
jgi:hypothetical protein